MRRGGAWFRSVRAAAFVRGPVSSPAPELFVVGAAGACPRVECSREEGTFLGWDTGRGSLAHVCTRRG